MKPNIVLNGEKVNSCKFALAAYHRFAMTVQERLYREYFDRSAENATAIVKAFLEATSAIRSAIWADECDEEEERDIEFELDVLGKACYIYMSAPIEVNSIEAYQICVETLVNEAIAPEGTYSHGFEFDYQKAFNEGVSFQDAAQACARYLVDSGWCY